MASFTRRSCTEAKGIACAIADGSAVAMSVTLPQKQPSAVFSLIIIRLRMPGALRLQQHG